MRQRLNTQEASGKSTETSGSPVDIYCEESFEEVADQTLYAPLIIEEYTEWSISEEFYASSLCISESYPSGISRQLHISGSMRSILYDWMMEVSAEYTLKRETFHLATSYVDRALQDLPIITKDRYQLVGLAGLCLAAKSEEVCSPCSKDWVRAVDYGYTISELHEMERALLKALNWKIYPTTAYNWISFLLSAWDDFLKFHYGCILYNSPEDFQDLEESKRKVELLAYQMRFIFFMDANRKAYKRYREILQILDVAVLHPLFYTKSPCKLVVALLYLMVSKHFYLTNYELIHYNEQQSLDDFENAWIVQELFINFIRRAVNLEIVDVHEEVVFMHQFIDLEILCDNPIVCKIQSKNRIERHYNEFLSYQTHNPHNLEFLTSLVKS